MMTGFSVLYKTYVNFFNLLSTAMECLHYVMYNHWFSGSRDAQCTGIRRENFALCGMLSSGRRNRMLTSLEMRVCLKLNSRVY